MRSNHFLTKKIILGISAALCFGMPCTNAAVSVETNPAASEMPKGGSFADGNGQIGSVYNQDGSLIMNIRQNTENATIRWNTFNVAAGNTVNFLQLTGDQPNAAAVTLNLVNGSNGVSNIAGTVNSIGSLVFVNPAGIEFATGSSVSAAGLILSTVEPESYAKGYSGVFPSNSTTNNNIIFNGTAVVGIDGAAATTRLAAMKTQLDTLKTAIEAHNTANPTAQVRTLAQDGFNNSVINNIGVKKAEKLAAMGNKIMLIADGDITVGTSAQLTAKTETSVPIENMVGSEGFDVADGSASAKGSILLRADKNNDLVNASGNAATITISQTDPTKINSFSVKGYFVPDIVSTSATPGSIGITSGGSNFVLLNYQTGQATGTALKNKVTNGEFAMLINDVYQLQAIDTMNNTSYGNLAGKYALAKGIDASGTSGWNGGAGFKPIGGTFTGKLSGDSGGDATGITGLHINRPTDDNVGLFKTMNGAVEKVAISGDVTGRSNVGMAAGLVDGGSLAGVMTSGTVNGSSANVGGIVGQMKNGSVAGSSNSATVTGENNNVGGVVGGIDTNGNASISGSSNGGKITGKDNTGGLVGNVQNNGNTVDINTSTNNGQIEGTNKVGGLVGAIVNGANATTKITKSYNTNEASTLSAPLTSEVAPGSAGSTYGSVTATVSSTDGTSGVGGLVGSIATTSSVSSKVEITTSYNAGNVKAEGTSGALVNAGGLVGNSAGYGSVNITKSYNADNNTVIKGDGGDTGKYYGFKDSSTGKEYTYDTATQTWKTGGEVVTVANLPDVDKRVYFNRLAYRDATVTVTGDGTNKVGGLVGNADEKTTLNQVYNAGKVTGTGSVGAAVGFGSPTIANAGDVFYVTTNNAGQAISGIDKAYGDGQADGNIKALTLNDAQNPAKVAWSDGTSTLNADNNQNADWIVYNTQTTPLLKTYMAWINIYRQYEYDGTVHNLTTDDVANYYGGAFFADPGMGRDVTYYDPAAKGVYNPLANFNPGDGNKPKNERGESVDWTRMKNTLGRTSSLTDFNSTFYAAGTAYKNVISRYTYDQSYMWSPQHAYYTDPKASVIITPKELTGTIEGEKIYGDNYLHGATVVDDAVAALNQDRAKGEYTGQYYISYDTSKLAGGDTIADDFTFDFSDVYHNGDKTRNNGGDNNNYWGVNGGNPYQLTQPQENVGQHTIYGVDGKATSINTYTADGSNTVYNSNNYNIKYTYHAYVKPKDLTITAGIGSKVYGDNSSIKYGADAGTVTVNTVDYSGDYPTVSTETYEGVPVFEGLIAYDITNTKLNDVAKYNHSLVSGSTVGNEKTDAGVYEDNVQIRVKNASDLSNYNVTYVTNDAIITKAPLTSNAGNATKVYGEDDSTATWDDGKPNSISGLRSWDDTGADGAMLKNPDNYIQIVSTPGITQDAGTYPHDNTTGEGFVKVIPKDEEMYNRLKNYEVDVLTSGGTLTINPRPVDYIVDDNTKVYGETTPDNPFSGDFAAIAGNSASGIIAEDKDDIGTLDQSKYTSAKTANKFENVGTYEGEINADKTALETLLGGNYELKEVKKGDLEITKRPLHYIVGDNEKVYGETGVENPYVGDFKPAVTGEKAGWLEGTPVPTLDASYIESAKADDKTTHVGEYESEIGLNADYLDKTYIPNLNNNYTLVVEKGKLTVTPREVDYIVEDDSRYWGETLTDSKGDFASGTAGAKGGITDFDRAKLTPLTQGDFSEVGTDVTSDAGIYDGDITVSREKLEAMLGSDYVVKNIENGKLTIERAPLTYLADAKEYDIKDTVPSVQSGKVVTPNGFDVTGYLAPKDRDALTFITDPSQARSPGAYPIIGSGVSESKNYFVADAPLGWSVPVGFGSGLGSLSALGGNAVSLFGGGIGQSIFNATALVIKGSLAGSVADTAIPGVQLHTTQDYHESATYDDKFKKELKSEDLRGGTHHYNDGGHIEKETRNQIRHLTIEESGLKLNREDGLEHVISVDPSTQIDGTETVHVNVVMRVSGSVEKEKATDATNADAATFTRENENEVASDIAGNIKSENDDEDEAKKKAKNA